MRQELGAHTPPSAGYRTPHKTAELPLGRHLGNRTPRRLESKEGCTGGLRPVRKGTIGSALRRKVDGDKSASGLLKEKDI